MPINYSILEYVNKKYAKFILNIKTGLVCLLAANKQLDNYNRR